MLLATRFYYFVRSRTHRNMATVAIEENARRSHTELADRYASKAEDVAYKPGEVAHRAYVDAFIGNDQ